MSAPAHNNVDLDALLDLSEYDNNYHSPPLSPAPASKPSFASPVPTLVTTPCISPSAPQTLSGPSHNYDMYRQQTGFVPGAIANTMAVNQTNNTGYQDFGSLDYIPSLSPDNDLFDFNTSPSQGAMDLDFGSPADSQQLFNTVNPSTIEQEATCSLASPPVSTSSSVGRLWPGAHSQAALAKAQAQQRQQQRQRRASAPPKPRSKAPQPTDPIIEQKITQLLSSMRAKPSSPDDQNPAAHASLPRMRKEEDDMDEDERLLASEEGKKLSSKERRQLRNKVSARAFRSRRKEYITQLESEISHKVNENGDLRAQNRALLDENKRLTELTRMLLSSPSFSNFLDHLSTNPNAPSQALQVKVEPPPQAQEQSQVRKDVNPYGGQHSQRQQIGMAMIPEQSMDMSMLSLDSGVAYNFQPQVFVVDTPEIATAIDAALLSGKAHDVVKETFQAEEDGSKIEVPAIAWPAESSQVPDAADETTVDEEFESDPEFALFHSEPASSRAATSTPPDGDGLSGADLFGGVEAEKALSRLELVDATEEAASASLAMARVQRISASLESVVTRLELMTLGF